MDSPSCVARRYLGRGRRLALFSLVCLLLLQPLPGWGGGLTLSSSEAVSSGGYYQIDWEGGEDAGQFQLQESRVEDFSQVREIYRGTQTASVISGRGNGGYYYRIRQVDDGGNAISSWSTPLKVVVEHHSLGRAFLFFIVGLLVFAATLVAIIYGSRRHTV